MKESKNRDRTGKATESKEIQRGKEMKEEKERGSRILVLLWY